MDSSTLSIVLKAVDLASADIEAVRAQVTKLGTTSTETAAKTDAAAAATTKQGNAMKGLQVGAGVAAAAVAAIGGISVKMAGDFEAANTRLATSAGESASNLKMIAAGELDIANSTGTSTQQLSAGMYTVESAGYHAADALTILKAASQGAKTENADLGKVTDAVTSAMRDYNVPVGQAADVTSKMVAAVGQGKSTFEDFTGSLHSILPIASAAHISMNDILGDLASMTVHGISADQATQNMAESIRTLQKPSADASQYLASLGITASNLTDDLSSKGLSGTLQQISSAITEKMGPAGKVLVSAMNESKSATQDATAMIGKMPANLQTLAKGLQDGSMTLADYKAHLKELPTTQANLLGQFEALNNRAQGFSNILKSGSPAALSYSQALQKATGNATTMNVALMLTGENADYTNNAIQAVSKATADASGNVMGWSEVQDTFNFKFSQFKEQIQTTAIALGTALLPAAKSLFDALNSILKPLAQFAANNPQLASAIVLTTLATLAGGAAFLGLAKSVGEARKILTDVPGIFKAVTSVFSNTKTITATGEAIAGVGEAAGATAGAGGLGGLAAVLTGPVGLALFGAALAVGGGILLWKHYKDAAKDAGDESKVTAGSINMLTLFQQAQAKASAEQKKAVDDLKAAQNAIAPSNAALTKANKDIGLAQLSVNDALKKFGENSPQYKLAVQQLNDKEAAYRDTIHDASLKTLDLMGAQGKLKDANNILKDATSQLNGMLGDQNKSLGDITNTIKSFGPAAALQVKSIANLGQNIANVVAQFKNAQGDIQGGIASDIGNFQGLGSTIDKLQKAAGDLQVTASGATLQASKNALQGNYGTAPVLGVKQAGHNAGGTSFWSGGPTWLGEQGPELVDLPTGSRVTPAGQAGGGNETHYHFNVSVGMFAGQAGELNNLAIKLHQAMARVARQHGRADSWPSLGANLQ